MKNWVLFTLFALTIAPSSSAASDIVLSCENHKAGFIKGIDYEDLVYIKFLDHLLWRDQILYSTNLKTWNSWCENGYLEIKDSIASCEFSQKDIIAANREEAIELQKERNQLLKWPASSLNFKAVPWVRDSGWVTTLVFSTGKTVTEFKKSVVEDRDGNIATKSNRSSYEGQCSIFLR